MVDVGVDSAEQHAADAISISRACQSKLDEAERLCMETVSGWYEIWSGLAWECGIVWQIKHPGTTIRSRCAKLSSLVYCTAQQYSNRHADCILHPASRPPPTSVTPG